MTNPLLGKRISLVSKKNIRYEGVLYSINEQNATVALQNVKTFGTEGRESTEEGCVYVAATETVHPYLLFRGQDIKDLHVHEPSADDEEKEATPTDPAEPAAEVTKPQEPSALIAQPALTPESPNPLPLDSESVAAKQQPQPEVTANKAPDNSSNNKARRPRGGPRPKAAPGTGASLLNRSARGVVVGPSKTPQEDFDFQSNLEKFKEDIAVDEEENDDLRGGAYEKDDFFDSISCDAIDKQTGIDNRLRGSAERKLNSETFGAVALNTQRRRGGRGGGRGGNGGGRGRGRGGGRGRGRGRGGRGRGRSSVTASS